MLKAFLSSRKFWLALVGAIVAGYLFSTGQIQAEHFIDAVLVLVGILTGGIALEDAALKMALRRHESGK